MANNTPALNKAGYAFKLLLLLPLFIFAGAFFRWDAGQPLQAEIICAFGIASLLIWLTGSKHPLRTFILSLILYTLLTAPVLISQPWVILTLWFLPVVPYVLLVAGIICLKTAKSGA